MRRPDHCCWVGRVDGDTIAGMRACRDLAPVAGLFHQTPLYGASGPRSEGNSKG